MPIIEPKLLPGFRDIPAGECVLRGEIIDRIVRVFQAFGFLQLRTPVLERAEVVMGMYGPELDPHIFQLGTDDGPVAMRYDLTVPLVRYVAQHSASLPLPLKRAQVGSVFRAREVGGRSRELLQADADILGTRSRVADAECVALMCEVLRTLEVPGFTISVNSRKLYRGLQNSMGLSNEGQYFSMLRVLNRLSTHDESAVRTMLEAECKFSAAQVGRIFEHLTLPEGSIDDQLGVATERFGGSELGRQGVKELREIFSVAVALGVPAEAMKFDPFTTRSLDYYTSTVFKTDIAGLPKFGSVVSGGRYDDLGVMFSGQIMPGVGISVRVDRLIEGLIQLGLREPVTMVSSPARVYVMIARREQLPAALQIVTKLRQAGISCDLAHDPAQSEQQQLRHAAQLAVPFVLTIDPAEGDDHVTLSSTSDGTQAVVTMQQAIDALTGVISTD